jgi:hypothetical protein
MSTLNPPLNPYARWFRRLLWLGILANLGFVVPMLFFPEVLLGLLKMTVPYPVIWTRASGLLLLEISIGYIPIALDPYRYRVFAWLAIAVMRGGGASFFLCAVLFFHQELGFISIALVDTFFLSFQAYFLHRALSTAPRQALEFATA